MIVKLVGYNRYFCDSGGTEVYEDVVATFDSKVLASKYITDSRIKNSSDTKRPFKRKSLLAKYEFETTIVSDSPVPHNPKI